MTRWGDEKTLFFICLYREQECLWNIQSPLYKNRAAREHAYRQILTTFNDSQLDMKSCKVKIKNLRSVYRMELRKIRERREAAYRPCLSWFEEMHSFLGDTEDRLEENDTGVCETDIQKSPENPQSHDLNIKFEVENLEEAELEEAKLEEEIQVRKPKPLPSKLRLPPKRPIQRTIRKRKNNETLLNTLKRLEHAISGPANRFKKAGTQDDEFTAFALSVAAQLRQLPIDIAVNTQSKIQNLLSEARLSSISSTSVADPLILNVKSEIDEEPE